MARQAPVEDASISNQFGSHESNIDSFTNLVDAAAFIDESHALGVRIALDDFGAGSSSFGYLKALPVDFLKIDGQFITHLLDNALDRAAVRCFREVAKILNVQTIAEFVEVEAVREELGRMGIDRVQGYLVHRPEPLAALMASPPVKRPPAARPYAYTKSRKC